MTSTSQALRGMRRALPTFLAVLFASTSGYAGELPDHYFIGQVCRDSKQIGMKSPSYPCDRPIRGASVTLQNSLGTVAVATTGRDGKYLLEPMPLLGHDDDMITIKAKGLVGLRVNGLHFDPQIQRSNDLGATILLRKERAMKVTVY